MPRLRCLALVLVMCAATMPRALIAQATTINGRVTTETGGPLADATVSIPALSVGARTDTTGRYSFTIPGARERLKGEIKEKRSQNVLPFPTAIPASELKRIQHGLQEILSLLSARP